jgi:tetratricopeptide (TPR) repeat protein
MPDPPLPEESIFAQAQEIESAAERAAFLDRTCGDNRHLRAEVEALLRAAELSGDLLDLPEHSPATADLPGAEGAGTVIGPYKLLEQIGEGGMGTVWMAEQTEPIQRRVAVKVVKEGMDSKQVLARFEAERQALALMEHPNIAKVLDAGKAPSGRPYFVMELVKGQPITKYCDERRLGVRDRLELFGDVCRAVQHAHQKGVIHRDLKPSNVLVAPFDGRPVVKVIDFGVAKATGQRLTDKTLFTGFGALVGTPEYMSPEQAEVNNQDIDTRSDVYALGVLLYELLTGSTPLTRQRVKEAALLEVLRVIREEEPPKPSTRLSESRDSLPSISAQRQTEPAKLTKLVRGELDWIVMKALEKDRDRRYETANGIAMDIQRYLADEPVLACPPSAGYRLRKFARRNQTAVAVTGLVLFFVALLGGGAGWVMRDRAARQDKAASELGLALARAEQLQGQGDRAEAVAALERAELLAGQAPADAARQQRLAILKERLAADGRDQVFLARYEAVRLQSQSTVDTQSNTFARTTSFHEIRDALRAYGIDIGVTAPVQAAAHIQSRPEAVGRTLIAALDECLMRAPADDEVARQWLLAGLQAADNDAWRVGVRKALMARDWETLGPLIREADVRRHPPGFLLIVAHGLAERLRAAELDLLRRTQTAYPNDLWANHQLAYELDRDGQSAEAVRYYTAAVALRPNSAGIYVNRGRALSHAGEAGAAIEDYYRAIGLSPLYVVAHFNLAINLRQQGKVDEAIARYQKILTINPKFIGAHINLGNAFRDQGKLDAAIACYRNAIAVDPGSALAHNGLGVTLLDTGRVDDAIAECRTATQLKRDFAQAYDNLGNALRANGQPGEAIAEYREALRLQPDVAETHNGLGTALADNGQLDEAIAEHRKAIRLKENYPEAYYDLGNVLRDKGAVDDAIAAYRRAIRLKTDYAEAHCNLGQFLRQQGRFREGLAELRRGDELGSRNPRWPYRSAQWIRACERQIELDDKLPGFIGGRFTPASPAERIELADLCLVKRLPRAAVRFFEQAFAAQPKLAEDLDTACRYNAACAAALAGCCQGQDADKPDDTERARLRRQAVDWLRADLAEWNRLLAKEPTKARPAIRTQMQQWLGDTDLAGVRGRQALAKLPELERQPWQKLWDDVADLLARARPKATPDKKSSPK